MRKWTLGAAIAAALSTSTVAMADVGFIDGDTVTFSSPDYVGTFTYNGVEYGVGGSPIVNSFDVDDLDPGFTRIASQQTIDGNTVNVAYRFYKQQYSTVVGNTTNAAGHNRQFVRDIVGDPTTSLPNNTTYNYSGVVFNHIDQYSTGGQTYDADGTLVYTITVDGSGSATGSGSFTGVSGNRPVTGLFSVSGTLESTPVTTQADGRLGITGGDVTLDYTDASGTTQYTDSSYDLGVYGPNAEEVAGGIYGGQLEAMVSGYGFAGVR
ncbi:factor H binding protein domain-containing protein [Alcanivorax sp. 24]|uniref:factor H binding protein domain-containing protein n=1 Tax=Alcanivorax sp. 24 TaxID=2545266 RepID=UPI0010607EF3|nr:factor H binding protein domain-containing protein [Alcanivorax sp. 24]